MHAISREMVELCFRKKVRAFPHKTQRVWGQSAALFGSFMVSSMAMVRNNCDSQLYQGKYGEKGRMFTKQTCGLSLWMVQGSKMPLE
jgi:hypothetical protein